MLLRAPMQGSVELNLELLAQRHKQNHPDLWMGASPFLNPQFCEAAVQFEHERFRVSASYGGYLEDRRTVWHGNYLDATRKWIHLGIDVNAAPGTPVTSDNSGRVRSVSCDYPEPHGCGTRVDIELDDHPIVLLYGHLARRTNLRVGDRVRPGDVLGTIGSHRWNGGWYPHAHVQAVQSPLYNQQLVLEGLRNLDGYGRVEDFEQLRIAYPNPAQFVKLP